MRGQMLFPAGFGCDPTVASGRDMRGLPDRRPPMVGSAPSRVGDIERPTPSPRLPHGRIASRLEEIEAQRRTSAPAGMAPALWSSVAIGLVLAGSLYFLNYF